MKTISLAVLGLLATTGFALAADPSGTWRLDNGKITVKVRQCGGEVCANIVGLKDCSADTLQSVDLLCRKPSHFAVLTGEDALFYSALAQGADGGILASAHVETLAFTQVAGHVRAGNQPAALAAWSMIGDLPRLLFAEPSPAPIKHWLWRQGLIDSPEVRLPMVPVRVELAARTERRMTTDMALAGA